MSITGWIVAVIASVILYALVLFVIALLGLEKNEKRDRIIGICITVVALIACVNIFPSCPYNGDIHHDAKVFAQRMADPDNSAEEVLNEVQQAYIDNGWGLFNLKEMMGEASNYNYYDQYKNH